MLILEVNYSFCDPQQNSLVRECYTSPTKGQKMGKIFVKIKDRHVIIHDTRGGDMVWLNDQRQQHIRQAASQTMKRNASSYYILLTDHVSMRLRQPALERPPLPTQIQYRLQHA